jgi:hypothetical protein
MSIKQRVGEIPDLARIERNPTLFGGCRIAAGATRFLESTARSAKA